MTMEPLVSVNMAAYNAAPYIAEAIQSVMNQTFQNWELIIINDCSTDNTANEIGKFSDERIKVFHNEQNEGIVYTRNRALHYSTGKYISVLDADDVFLPKKLETQVTFLENNTDYGMVGSAFRIINKNSVPAEKPTCLYAKAEYFPAILLFNNFFAHSSVMMRTHLAKEILYKPLIKGYSPCEEYQLYVKIARNHKVYNLPEELVYYREHSSGISKLRQDKINEYIDLIIKNQLMLLHIFPDSKQLDLHKSIRFAFDNIEWNNILAINNWIKKLTDHNRLYKIYNSHFEDYLASKWYEIAKFNANFGIRMLIQYYSSPLSFNAVISFEQRKLLLHRCLYEFKRNLF